MPVSMSEVVQDRRTFTMQSKWGPIQWTYRPYQMTPSREAEITRLSGNFVSDEFDADTARAERNKIQLVNQFCEVVEATDMVGPLHKKVDPRTGMGIGEPVVEAGDTIPITPEIVQYFSGRFIVEVMVAVARDARPKAQMQED